MKKQIIILGLLAVSLGVNAQKKHHAEADTIKIQVIEDVNLHKTGNPNKARTMSTKSNLTVMENPQAISIVTHEIIEQQQAKQLSDVLQNVNGVYITSSRGGSQDSFGGRGFSLGNDNIFKNGGRINSGVFPEVSGLERVEVLKGANAMLYGNTAAGGVINMVTKKPKFTNGGSVSMNIGSWNTYKPTIDIYGPLSKKVAFRVNGSYEYAESFRDVVKSQKHYFNPSVLFNIGEKSQLIVEVDYLKNRFTPDFGIGGITNKNSSYELPTNIGRNVFFGTDWQYQDVQQLGSNITFNTQLNKNWTLNAIATYQNYTKDYFSTERVQWGYNTKISPNELTWTVPFNKTYNEQNYASAQVNLNGEFKTGNIGHKVLVGADADYNQADSYTYNLLNTPNKVVYLNNTSTWDNSALAMPESTLKTNARTTTRRIGVYAQDFISLNSQWKVIAGLRWSYIENMPTQNTFFSDKKPKEYGASTSDNALSPKIGVVYMPNDNLSVFATYTNSFATNTGYTSNALESVNTSLSAADVQKTLLGLPKEALKPTTIDQYEIGAKKNFWNNALAVNLSFYQILYNKYYQTYWFINAADNTVVTSNDTNLKEYAGKMRSRGVELDITGNPTEYLSIIAGFSYNNSVYLDTPEKGYIEKQRLVRTPATTVNASIFYKFTNSLKGLKVGAGAYFMGDRLSGWNDSKSTSITRNNVSRTFKLKDYTTVSLSAGYDWKKFSLQAKVNNLFNVVNYNVHENYSVNPITPRNFYFTLTYKL